MSSSNNNPYQKEYKFTSEDRRKRYLEKHGLPSGFLSRPFHNLPVDTEKPRSQGGSSTSAGPSLFRQPIFNFSEVPLGGSEPKAGGDSTDSRQRPVRGESSSGASEDEEAAQEPVNMAASREESHATYFPGSPPILSGAGTDDCRSWFTFFELVAASKKWDGETRALNLPLYLRSEALEAYLQLTPEQKGNYEEAKRALLLSLCPQENERLIASQLHSAKQLESETVRQFHRRISNLSTQAYPGLSSASLDRLVMDFFVNGLRSELQFPFMTSSPGNLKDAVSIASRAEASMELFPSAMSRCGWGESSKKNGGKVRAVKTEKEDSIWREIDLINARLDLLPKILENKVNLILEAGGNRQQADEYSNHEVRRVTSSEHGWRSQRGGQGWDGQGPCYSCGEFGHIARRCPHYYYSPYPSWSDPQDPQPPQNRIQGQNSSRAIRSSNQQVGEEESRAISSRHVKCESPKVTEIFLRHLSTSETECYNESDSSSSSTCSISTNEPKWESEEEEEAVFNVNLEIEKEEGETRRWMVDAGVQVGMPQGQTPVTLQSRSTQTQVPDGKRKKKWKSKLPNSDVEKDDVSCKPDQTQPPSWRYYWTKMSFYICFLIVLSLLFQNQAFCYIGPITGSGSQEVNENSTLPYSVSSELIRVPSRSIRMHSQVRKWDIQAWDVALTNRHSV